MKSLQKIEKLQERALRFLYNDHKSSYNDLLYKSGKCTMQVSRQRALCIEIYKTMNNLNPPFMKNFFKFRSSHYSSRRPYDLKHIRPNQVTFGSNSLESVGPQNMEWFTKQNEICRKPEKFQTYDKAMEWSRMQMQCLQ